MGQTASNVDISSFVKAGTDVMNSAHDVCKTSVNQENIVSCDLDSCDSCGDIIGLTQKNFASVDLACTFLNENENSIKQCLNEQMAAAASAQNDALFPHGDVVANITEDMTLDLSNQIYNSFTGECTVDLAQRNAINTCGNIVNVDQENFANAQNRCMLDSISSSDAMQAITSSFDAAAESIATDPIADFVNGLFDNIGWVIIGVVAFLIVFLGGGEKIVMDAVSSPAFMISAVVLIIFLVVFFWIIYPLFIGNGNGNGNGENGNGNGNGENGNGNGNGENGNGNGNGENGNGNGNGENGNGNGNGNNNNNGETFSFFETQGNGNGNGGSPCNDLSDAVTIAKDDQET